MNRGIWLGFIFFIALVLMGFGTLLVKNWNPFKKTVALRIHFERAQGLRPGSDVRVDGIVFGRVDKVGLAEYPKSGVKVVINLDGPITLYRDSEIFVESASVLGGNIISIRRGSIPPTKNLEEELDGKPRPGLDEVGDLAAENRENLKQLIANLKDVSQSLKDGQGTIGKLLKSDELHKEAVTTIKGAREDVKKVGDSINDNLTRLTKKIEDKLDNAQGPAGALLNDKKLTEKLDRIVTNVEDTSKNLKDITETVKKGEGALGKMVHDKEMGEKLKSTIDNIERASESIRNIGGKLEQGEGSVGRLLQDDELYETAQRAISGLDKFFGRASNSVLTLYGEYIDYADTDSSVSTIGIRIGPDEDKYIFAGVSLWGLRKDGKKITFDKQIEDNEDDTKTLLDFQLAYKARWLFDRHMAVRGGYLEGKPGGAVEFTWDDWGLFSYPVMFTFAARDAYNSVKREDIDEGISGPLLRAYVTIPLWIRKETWLEVILSAVHLHAGVNRIGSDPEFLVGLSLEWPDEDIRTMVALLAAGR